MRKRFKSKKVKKKHHIIKLFITLVILYISYQSIMYIFINMKLVNGNDEFLKAMLNDSNHHLLYEKKANNLINKTITFFSNIDFSKPTTIIDKSLGKVDFGNNDDSKTKTTPVVNYVENPNQNVTKNPRVYIYNTHQGEKYSDKNLQDNNITPNVMMASYLLEESLNKLNIGTLAEEGNIIEFMNLNNWGYNDSYKASRFFIIDALNKNKDLDLIIDLHRDALSKDASTITINNKKYAKIMFVVGLEHTNYKKNQTLSNKLNSIINDKYPGLSRGVLDKEGENSNGIYNQDLSHNMVLLEIGGQENTVEEVVNTIEAMSQVIKVYLGV